MSRSPSSLTGVLGLKLQSRQTLGTDFQMSNVLSICS